MALSHHWIHKVRAIEHTLAVGLVRDKGTTGNVAWLPHIVMTKVLVLLWQILAHSHSRVLLLVNLLSESLISVESAVVVWMHIDGERAKHLVNFVCKFVSVDTVFHSTQILKQHIDPLEFRILESLPRQNVTDRLSVLYGRRLSHKQEFWPRLDTFIL